MSINAIGPSGGGWGTGASGFYCFPCGVQPAGKITYFPSPCICEYQGQQPWSAAVPATATAAPAAGRAAPTVR